MLANELDAMTTPFDRSIICPVLFFFFQAEDGIRDYKVTGVQTCALPISGPGTAQPSPGPDRRRARLGEAPRRSLRRGLPQAKGRLGSRESAARAAPPASREIGRASCRERV